MPCFVDPSSFRSGTWSSTSIGSSISSGADRCGVGTLRDQTKERGWNGADNGNDGRLHRAACAVGSQAMEFDANESIKPAYISVSVLLYQGSKTWMNGTGSGARASVYLIILSCSPRFDAEQGQNPQNVHKKVVNDPNLLPNKKNIIPKSTYLTDHERTSEYVVP